MSSSKYFLAFFLLLLTSHLATSSLLAASSPISPASNDTSSSSSFLRSAPQRIFHLKSWLSSARGNAAAVSVGSYSLVAGGFNVQTLFSRVVDIYDAEGGTWSTATLCGDATFISAVSIGDTAAFILPVAALACLFNSTTGFWTTLPLPIPGQPAVAASIANQLLLYQPSSVSGNLYRYDITTGKWLDKLVMTGGVQALCVAVTVSPLVFFLCESTSWADVYNFTGDNIISVHLPRQFINAAITSVRGNIFIAGGCIVPIVNDICNETDIVDVFHVASRTWSRTHLTQARSYPVATFLHRDSVIFAGGMINQTIVNTTDLYNTTTHMWYNSSTHGLSGLSPIRNGLAATSSGIALFAGGQEYNGPSTDNVDLYAFSCTTDSDCDDGVFCNGQEICPMRGFCVSGLPPCPLWNPCNNSCNEAQRSCGRPLGFSCCQDSFCTVGDTCDGFGSCIQDPVCQTDCLTVCDSDKQECTASPKGTACGGRGISTCDGLGNCKMTSWFIAAVVLPMALAAFGLLICMAVLWRRRRMRLERIHQLQEPTMLYLNDITIEQRIAGGKFGEIYRGLWEGTTEVALKRLRDTTQIQSFAAEAATLLSLNHPNVVRLLGLLKVPSSQLPPDIVPSSSSSSSSPSSSSSSSSSALSPRETTPTSERFIVMEYVSLGSVDKLVKENVDDLSFIDLLGIAKHAAAGMRYLEGKNIVHRDLALRNLLAAPQGPEADTRYLVKVGDFGLSRPVQSFEEKEGRGRRHRRALPGANVRSQEIYASLLSEEEQRDTAKGEEEEQEEAIPVRWSAPEVLKDRTFSSKSDSWSFGMLLWELLSGGKQPFHTITVLADVVRAILTGERPPKPENCPDVLYELMQQCWRLQPEERPDFTEIYATLHAVLSERSRGRGLGASRNGGMNSMAAPSQTPQYASSSSKNKDVYANMPDMVYTSDTTTNML